MMLSSSVLAQTVGNLRVEPAQQEVGRTTLVTVECNAGDLILVEGSVGYFVVGTGVNGTVGGGARAIYCDGGGNPVVKTMSVQFLCVSAGYANFVYGSERVLMT